VSAPVGAAGGYRRIREAWGVDLSSPDPDPRRCPTCGVEILPGRAQCRTCYTRAEWRNRCATERAWMTRNFPGYRPRTLFPEDYEEAL